MGHSRNILGLFKDHLFSLIEDGHIPTLAASLEADAWNLGQFWNTGFLVAVRPGMSGTSCLGA